jgi:tetratricopeptide (TPR) repeat protein
LLGRLRDEEDRRELVEGAVRLRVHRGGEPEAAAVTRRLMKHNPAFLTKEELVEGFVVRLADLEIALEHVREQPEGPPQHMLLIGPRGIGKTTMVLRIAAAVKADPELGKKWYPLVFGEEAYEVGTAAELWLEAILHLAKQTGDARLDAAYKELKKQPDDKRLYEQALARLMDFADAQGKRLLVVIENMNMLLGEQLGDDDGWTLRHTLQNERRIMLIGTATTRFDEIDNVNKAMYDLFWTHDLRPLDTEECRLLWQSVSGQEMPGRRVRPIQILTGGSPRLLAILASFAADVSFRDLMLKLTDLVDDNTTYFKSNLESLPTGERKAYVALADIWSPATAREVAEAARLDVNKTSALLHRMVQRGAVSEVKARGRKVSYQVAERMYNIYHLMRRHGGDESRVRAVVQFMIHMYDGEGLVEVMRSVLDEACGLDPEAREDHFRLVSSMLRNTASPEVKADIITAINPDFFALEGAPPSVTDILRRRDDTPADVLRRQCRQVSFDEATSPREWMLGIRADVVSLAEAEAAARRMIDATPDRSYAWALLGIILSLGGQIESAEAALRRGAELSSGHVGAYLLEFLGEVLRSAGREQDAEEAYKRSFDQDPDNPRVAIRLGEAHDMNGRHGIAEKYYRVAIGMDPANVVAWNGRGRILLRADKYQPAEELLRQAIGLKIADAMTWGFLAAALAGQHRHDEAEHAAQEAVRASKTENEKGASHVTLAHILLLSGKWDDALTEIGKAPSRGTAADSLISQITKIYVEVAAAGHSAEALSHLRALPTRYQLEPLLVALQRMVGEEHNAPEEVVEVAKDIVQQIEALEQAAQQKKARPAKGRKPHAKPKPKRAARA